MASTVRREIGNDQSRGVYRLFRSALKCSVRITPTKRVRQRYRYLDLTGQSLPILIATLWMSSGGSPMTFYRNICARMQAKFQVVARDAQERAAPLK